MEYTTISRCNCEPFKFQRPPSRKTRGDSGSFAIFFELVSAVWQEVVDAKSPKEGLQSKGLMNTSLESGLQSFIAAWESCHSWSITWRIADCGVRYFLLNSLTLVKIFDLKGKAVEGIPSERSEYRALGKHHLLVNAVSFQR